MTDLSHANVSSGQSTVIVPCCMAACANTASPTLTGGSSGWQAPEQLLVIDSDGGYARQTRAMDVFSLGCVLYYCITAGRHPFGENYERDTNILRGQPNLRPLQALPDALNLVAAMLEKAAGARPSMQAVLSHPVWWSNDQRLQFLVDASDRWAGWDAALLSLMLC